MQSQKEKETKNKSKKPSIVALQKENNNTLFEQWNSCTLIPGKLTLLDWYHLLIDEEEDLNLVLCPEILIKKLSNKCLESFISQNLVKFTVYKTRQDILRFFQYFDINPSYNKDCKWNRKKFLPVAESDEPKVLSTGSLCVGLERILFLSDIIEKTVSTKSSISTDTVSNCQFEYSTLSPQILSILEGSTRLRQRQTSVERKLRRDTVWPKERPKIPLSLKTSDTSSIHPIAEEKLPNEKEEIEVKPQLSKEKRKKSRRLPQVFSPKHEMSDWNSQTEAKMEHQAVPARRISIRKSSYLKPTSSKMFERVDLNHPSAMNRVKTGYIIKDSEVAKDSLSISVKRSPYASKKSSLVVTESKEKTTTAVASPNIMTMPPLVENINILTNGVSIIQNGVKKSSLRSPIQPRQDISSQMHVLKMERKEPKLKVSQLLDPKRPPLIQRPLKL